MSEQSALDTPSASIHLVDERPFTKHFLDKNSAAARRAYLKIVVGGCFLIVVAIFAVFSIYWGALWKTPVNNLGGWVVDFDGGVIGQTVVQGLTAGSPVSKITWKAVPSSQFPGGLGQLGDAVVDQQTWVAIAIQPGSSARLQASYITPNSSYNGSDAITVYVTEARNENAFRSLIRPSIQASFAILTEQFAFQALQPLVASPNLTSLLETSPQTVLTPISYTIDNLVPFDIPVASAVTFVGLIYQLILSFFVVMIGYAARDASGLNRSLTLGSLITVRFVSAFVAYFIISLFYSLLSLAFLVDFSRKFGSSGFVIFWMLNWLGMLSVGLALEALITLLTTSFLPFFMILWIIVNVSVCILPIEVLPSVYRYGYGVPFYNVSHAVRCIVFGTKNDVGLNFGVLIIWTAISCMTLPLIQWFVRRKAVAAESVPIAKSVEDDHGGKGETRKA